MNYIQEIFGWFRKNLGTKPPSAGKHAQLSTQASTSEHSTNESDVASSTSNSEDEEHPTYESDAASLTIDSEDEEHPKNESDVASSTSNSQDEGHSTMGTLLQDSSKGRDSFSKEEASSSKESQMQRLSNDPIKVSKDEMHSTNGTERRDSFKDLVHRSEGKGHSTMGTLLQDSSKGQDSFSKEEGHSTMGTLLQDSSKGRDSFSKEEETKLDIMKGPQCLIETDTTGKLMLREEVLAELQQLDKPMVVVAIAGFYRTGKSYLMNKLASASKGFALGNTIESKTKGIWIWVQCHPKKMDTYLVLLDTEGLGDAQKADPDHDNWIFTLAVLLSSAFVYNFLGAINEEMFGKLHFISVISKKLKINKEDKEGDNIDFDKQFPPLILTARDFYLDLEIDGQEVSADEYLEHMLALKDNQPKDSQEARRCIRQYFRTRKCFTFDRPGDREVLKKLDILEEECLSKCFRESTREFLSYVFRECPKLSLPNGQEVNGAMFVTLAVAYIDAIRQGEVPCIESAYATMARKENEKVITEILDSLPKVIMASNAFPTNTDGELTKLLAEHQQSAINSFVAKAVFDVNGTYKSKFLIKLQTVYSEIEEQNRKVSRMRCEKVLEKLEQPIKERHSQGFYMQAGGHKIYSRDLKELKNKYQKKKDLGVLKREILVTFSKQEAVLAKAIVQADAKLTHTEKEAEEARVEMALQKDTVKMQADKLQHLEQACERQKQAAEETASRMADKMEKDLAATEKKHAEITEKRMKEQRALLEEGFDKRADELKREMSDSNDRFKNDLKQARRQNEAGKQRFEKHIESLEVLLASFKQQMFDMEKMKSAQINYRDQEIARQATLIDAQCQQGFQMQLQLLEIIKQEKAKAEKAKDGFCTTS